MTKIFTLVFILLSVTAFAQPINDDCNGIIHLGEAPFCPTDTFFSNVGATPSSFGFGTDIPGCLTSGNSPRDVWFQFTASTDPTITDYEITVTGMDDGTGSTPLSTPQLMLYRGFCVNDELIIIACQEAALSENTVTLQVDGLNPGGEYFLRIGDYATGAPNAGTFKICVEEKAPDVIISNGTSTACSGVLYDSGGADGDYGPNENFVFTICPTDFHQCISFNLDYYNLEEGVEVFKIYDGADVNGTLLADLSGGFGSANSGGVAMQLYATSGCITVEFQSDNVSQFEGFKATWQCSPDLCPQSDLLTVEPTADTATIIDFLKTPSAIVHIDTINCDKGGYGSFEATDNSGLGIKRGLLLTNGSANYAIGPNNSPGQFDGLGGPGDADLDSLSILLGEGSESHDACIVELEVYAFSDELTFEYIFGSEEYPEFVNSSFNDIFAFLVSGPGITGVPELNNQQNIAVLPNTNTPVQINSVNNINNWQYYRDNINGQSVQYDGLTADSLGIKKSLTAKIKVIPCNTYKLKLAIADRGDDVLDSGVFISEIKAGSPKIAVDFTSGLDYFVEKCTNSTDTLVIALDAAVTEDITYTVNISGDAQNGADYNLTIPNSLTFSPTKTFYKYPIQILDDNLVEGTEHIIISLSHDFGCGEVTFDDLIIELKDNIEVQLNVVNDTAKVCKGEGFQLEASGAFSYLWTPAAIFDDNTSSSPFVNPNVSQTISVTGFVGICQDTRSIFLDVIDVTVDATASDLEFCTGDTIQLTATSNLMNPTYTWSPAFFFEDVNLQNQEVSPSFNTDYVVEVEQFGCKASDTLFVKVDFFTEPNLINDTTICLGSSVQLGDGTFFTSTTYDWSPGGTLSDSTITDAIATPTELNTTYTIVATSENGYCSSSNEVKVTTIPAVLNVVQLPNMIAADTIFLCAPDSVELLAQTSTMGVGLTWTPINSTLTILTDTTVKVKPIKSGLYIATLEVGECTLHDSVFVRIDSLPEFALQAVPIKDPFCPGDTVSLFSQSYSLGDYPNITHHWTPMSGQISDADNFNLVVITEDTITYTRTSQNGACSGSVDITLNVDKPADISVTQDKTIICKGDDVQLNATSPDGNEFEWSPENGLSCTECPNPVSTPESTITYEVKLKGQNCPSSETATITVKPSPTVQFPADNNLCLGESITLNEFNNPAITYTWTSDDPNFTTTTDPQPTVSPTETHTYTVVLSDGDCEATESITVNVFNDNVTIEGPDGICPGFPITLNAVSNGTGSYVWMPDNLEGQSITVEPTTPTTYNVTYTYGDGCIATASKSVVVYPVYTVTVTPDKTPPVYSGESITFAAVVTPPVSNPNFNWFQNGNQLGEHGSTVTVEASTATADNITATLQTAEGCEYSGAFIFDILPIFYDIPNAFTPNGDAINETFRPVFIEGYEFVSLRIYNRWGQLMYEGKSAFKGWDGRYKEKEMPSDAYPFVMELKRPNGTIKKVKGDLTLIR